MVTPRNDQSRLLALAMLVLLIPVAALAHDVAQSDKAFVSSIKGPAIVPFLYLGAKHMVTGYDHIAFLVGVVFFLRRLKDVVLYVSLFTLGHSTTLLSGVLLGFGVNTYIIDAIIGLSVVYAGLAADHEPEIDSALLAFGALLNGSPQPSAKTRSIAKPRRANARRSPQRPT